MSDPLPSPRYAEFAAVVLDTPAGDLAAVLFDRFPDITRAEVFLGAAFAKAVWQADQVLALGEIRALELQLQQRRAA